MNVFVIVVTYNASTWLDKCFGNLQYSTIPLKVIVVDNGSTDGTVSILKEKYQRTEVFAMSKNLGFGKANNLGIKIALQRGADYVLLLNQDAWVEANTIEGLINLHADERDYGIISPIHLNGRGNKLDYRFSLCCNEIDCPGFISDNLTKEYKGIYQISFVNAAIWLIPRECLLKVGLFDPIFPHYGEDTDYVNRVKYHGFKIGISPHYFGYHDREDRPLSYKRERTMRKLGYLCDLKDINKSFFLASIKVFFYIVIRGFRKLFSGKFRSFCYDFLMFIVLTKLTPKVVVTRRICKGTSAFV